MINENNYLPVHTDFFLITHHSWENITLTRAKRKGDVFVLEMWVRELEDWKDAVMDPLSLETVIALHIIIVKPFEAEFSLCFSLWEVFFWSFWRFGQWSDFSFQLPNFYHMCVCLSQVSFAEATLICVRFPD